MAACVPLEPFTLPFQPFEGDVGCNLFCVARLSLQLAAMATCASQSFTLPSLAKSESERSFKYLTSWNVCAIAAGL